MIMTERNTNYYEQLIAAEKAKIKELRKKQQQQEKMRRSQRNDLIVRELMKKYPDRDLYAMSDQEVIDLITTGTLPENEQVPALLNPEAETTA